MQTNTIEIMASDQFSGSWSAIPYGYGDYSVPPSADWMTSPSTNLESARQSCESLAQQNNFFQPTNGRAIHRHSSQSSPAEAAEAEATINSYPYAVPYHHHQHQAANYGPNPHVQQNHPQKQPQPAKKIASNSARYVPHGYYTQTGRTLTSAAAGSPAPQQSLYPSPPGQVLSTEETNYNGKPFGMVYMNGNHPSAPIGYTGYTEPVLTSLCSGPVSNDLYQPYNVSPMSYGESAAAYPAIGLSTLESPFAPLKYDAWTSESSIIQPLMSPMEHPIAIKQEYIPSAFNTPSPSTITGGSCIKMELLSDSSLSPPPGNNHPAEVHGSHDACKSPSSSHLLPPPNDKRSNSNPGTMPVKKATRKTNNYGDQYACLECSRTFARQCGLTQHTKWHHSGEKPFRCITCGKCFSEQIALDDHLERHTSTDKPYQCLLCPKAFFHKNDLRRHGFQHSGKAPHACRYCSKTFARKDHCHSHEGSHERKMQRKQRRTKRVSVAHEEQLQSQQS
ncbi:PR domain zinc finger protein 1-like [Anopheles moucheti]|uniref:PR domain zinc finger protein 1-like n=1 Tax=Anopheles moucheti TaxID=186751 RepID=UPI0022F02984|nr:PR domain zinc finger protein 1-like [Anopheles moucheti]